MVSRFRLVVLCVVIVSLLGLQTTQASIIEVGDLNIINDMGNPSDGLSFLDMSFSDGLTLSAALLNAQGTYADARLATPSEMDDLFMAAGYLISVYSAPATVSRSEQR